MKKFNIIYSRSVNILREDLKPEFRNKGLYSSIRVISIVTRWFWFKPKTIRYGHYGTQDTWYQLTGGFKKVPRNLNNMLDEEVRKNALKEIRLESEQNLRNRIDSEMKYHRAVFEAHGIDIEGY
jgi:hypothetical protein